MYISNRTRTRDLLLEYAFPRMDYALPHTRAGGLGSIYIWRNSNVPDSSQITGLPVPNTPEFSVIYPWETYSLSMLSDQIYLLAMNSGYTGSREDFHKYFVTYLERNKWEIVFDEYTNFPEEGVLDKLYFDLNEKILYYWDNGYIPVNAMLIAQTILDGGEA